MHESDVLVFLLSLAVLLSCARIFGELARRLGLPLVFGELASGIVLGPTIFGRLAPTSQRWLFQGGTPQHMLAGYTNVGASFTQWIGILLRVGPTIRGHRR
jgi:Kef-type K+ transport system membrane component KefB